MSVEDPDRPRRLRRAIVTSVVSSGLLGGFVFGVNLLEHFGRPVSWIENAIFYSANTTAVAFWLVFLPSYVLKVDLTPAELAWERNLKRAEEIFKREKALGRGSWWM